MKNVYWVFLVIQKNEGKVKLNIKCGINYVNICTQTEKVSNGNLGLRISVNLMFFGVFYIFYN